MKKRNIVYIFIVIVLVFLNLYFEYSKEEKQNNINKYLGNVILYDDDKSRITNVKWDKNLVAITIDIQSGQIGESKKNTLAKRSKIIVSERICSDGKLLALVKSGYMMSIDITSNGNIKSFTNILIHKDTCE